MLENAESIIKTLRWGTNQFVYELTLVDRETMEIAVHPDACVRVKAPLNATEAIIETKLRKRAGWIIRQIRYFNQFNPLTPPRSYLSGETHLYLGRHYRLKTIPFQSDSVKLMRGFFIVETKEDVSPAHVKTLMEDWYLEKAQFHFQKILKRCIENFPQTVELPELHLRAMKKRWGSMSRNGVLTLNPELIKAPIECIDYVITHELCHLVHPNHSPDFYRLLDYLIPQWEKVKHRLELTMS